MKFIKYANSMNQTVEVYQSENKNEVIISIKEIDDDITSERQFYMDEEDLRLFVSDLDELIENRI